MKYLHSAAFLRSILCILILFSLDSCRRAYYPYQFYSQPINTAEKVDSIARDPEFVVRSILKTPLTQEDSTALILKAQKWNGVGIISDELVTIQQYTSDTLGKFEEKALADSLLFTLNQMKYENSTLEKKAKRDRIIGPILLILSAVAGSLISFEVMILGLLISLPFFLNARRYKGNRMIKSDAWYTILLLLGSILVATGIFLVL